MLRQVKPRSVLSMGGYVAGPGGLAAWLLRRPLLVHEQNRVAGFTNRKLAGFAQARAGRFRRRACRRPKWVGNPVRDAIAALPPPAQRLAGRSGRPRLLVLGGSLGARALNLRGAAGARPLTPAQRPRCVHQCGSRGLDEARAAYAKAGVEAQVVAVHRRHGGRLRLGRPGRLPRRRADPGRTHRGRVWAPCWCRSRTRWTTTRPATREALVASGAAELMQERELDVQILAQRLESLLADRGRLLAMAEAARTLAKPDAAQVDRAAHCLEVAA